MDCLTKLDLRNDFFEGIRHLRYHILLQGSTFVGIYSMGYSWGTDVISKCKLGLKQNRI